MGPFETGLFLQIAIDTYKFSVRLKHEVQFITSMCDLC